MLLIKHTAHTHLAGSIQHVYSEWSMKMKHNTTMNTRPKKTSVSSSDGASSDATGARAGAGIRATELSDAYLTLLATFMDEVHPSSHPNSRRD